jgi:hypothetical protein
MGCDIPAMVEAKRTYEYLPGTWSWTSCGRLHISRNYTLFAQLANVRNNAKVKPISEPRLIDVFVDEKAEWDDETTSEDFHALAKDYGVDGHSHSFVTVQELDTVDPLLASKCRMQAMACGHDPETARLVFFFDN